ncbi:hypothetical protein Tco_0089017 [Tanacetum coccineum]
MTILAEFMILSGGDNRPPMLDKDLYDSWQSRMELYMENREHGRMILESVKNGPLIWPTIEENGVIRTKKYVELSAAEKIQADCDVKATNIILQGLPTDIYALVNHHRVAKDLWERVQLLMQGTSLIKHERECKLYDAFDKFAYIKEESLHEYYLLPKWSKFVMDVKLVKDLHTTNFNHIHAYLEQHELHANEVRLMRERNQDPLALVANHQQTLSHFNTYQYSYNNPPLQQQFSPSQSPQYGSIHPTQQYSTTYPSTPLAIIYLSAPYPNSSTVHQNIDSGLTVPVFKQGDDPIDAINKMMSFLKFLADPGNPEGPVTQTVITNNAAYQANDLDAYDYDCDDITTAKVALMANLSHYSSYVLSEYLLETQNTAVQDTNSSTQQDAMILSVFEQLSHQVTNCNKVNKDNLIANESLSAELERYKEREKDSLTTTFNVLKNESKEKDAKNNDNEIALEKKVKELDNIVYKMELSVEQALWFQMLNSSIESSDPSPVKVDVPSELPKVSLVNESLKKLKSHLAKFDSVVRTKITPSTLTEDNASYTACKSVKQIQELLGYVRDTCPDIHKPSGKLVAVTPINKRKTVRFAEPITSSSTNKETQYSNKPLLHSTGVKCSTSSSGSKPSGNTKNNRISQPSSGNKINKVEDQPRSDKSRKNKKNRVNKTKCNDHVMQSMLDANSVSESISNAPVKNSMDDEI